LRQNIRVDVGIMIMIRGQITINIRNE